MDVDATAPATEAAAPPAAKFSLNILATIKDAQLQHGLRHGDYQRYRQYCSRRLHRVRTSLNFMCGKHKYVDKPLTPEMVTDTRYLLIPLVQAERCWAFAQQLKHEARAEDFHPRKLQHMRAKLAKAAKYAKHLETLAGTDATDPRTTLEAKAYSASMQGTNALELEDWQAALQHFNLAKVIYGELASTLPEEGKAIYTQRISDMEPHIRYCTHTLGLSNTDISDLLLVSDNLLVAKIEMVKEQEHAKRAATLREVKWYGRVVPVPSERLMTIILRAQEKRQSVEDSKADPADRLQLYDKVFSDLQDAKDQLNDEKNRKQKGSKQAPLSGAQVQLLQSYLDFERLRALVDRNILMIEEGQKAGRADEAVALHDAIIQSLTEMQHLPGVDQDAALMEELDMCLAAAAAHRLYAVARAYLAAGKAVEAAALAQAVLERKVPTALAACQKTDSVVAKRELRRLQDLIKACRGLKCMARATVALPLEGSHAESAGAVSLIKLPPDMQPVACKPLFFDLALSAMPQPDLTARSQQQGLGSYFKSWVWGR